MAVRHGRTTFRSVGWALILEGVMLRVTVAAVILAQALFLLPEAQCMEERMVAQAAGAKDDTSKAPSRQMPGKGEATVLKIPGTVSAINKDEGTVTLKGPGGRTVTLEVRDKAKLDAVNVGDPVVATYMEAVAFQVKKPGTATPGVTAQEGRASSKPGENPAGVVGREITVTATITAIDKKAHTVTIKGPEGNTETVKARDPKNLNAIKVGDLVEITYTQARAIALDKPANAPAKK